MNLRIYVDGGCLGNGKADATAYGSYKAFNDEGEVVFEVCRTPLMFGNNIKATNNLAEARIMQLLITHLYTSGYINGNNTISIFSDSQLIISHIMGVYRVNKKELLDIYKSIYAVFKKCHTENGHEIWKTLRIDKISGDEMKEILGH